MHHASIAPSLLLLPCLLLAPACKKTSDGPGIETPAADETSEAGETSETSEALGEHSGPALWSVRDEDTTVYLFGTVHVLKPELQWRTPAVDAAFEEASVVYFEADVSSAMAQAKMLTLMPELGTLKDGQTLSSLLSAAQLDTLGQALELLGLPMAMLEPMCPWLVGITMQSQALLSSGYDPQSGVEVVLGAEADAADKELRYFETAEQQLRIFAELPQRAQIDFLVDTAEGIRDDPDALDELVGLWAKGDTAGLLELVAGEDSMGSEAVSEALLTKRNADWTQQLQALMHAEPGVFFVAVGAAHLLGPEGVPALLEASGVSVTGPN